MSESQRGEAHPMHGRKHAPESLAKMRASKATTTLRGPESPVWKGGRFKSRGYWMVSLTTLLPEDVALAAPMVAKGRAYLPEHRLVMARMLTRPLVADEVVHHINGVKTDNRPENLEIHGARTHKMTHADLYRELRELRALAARCSCGTFPPAG
jgi:hypothetical protein